MHVETTIHDEDENADLQVIIDFRIREGCAATFLEPGEADQIEDVEIAVERLTSYDATGGIIASYALLPRSTERRVWEKTLAYRYAHSRAFCDRIDALCAAEAGIEV